MKRADLEHVIRAAATVTGEYEFVIIGSQSILGPIPRPPTNAPSPSRTRHVSRARRMSDLE